MGVFGLLMDTYDRVRATMAEQTAVAQATEIYVAFLTAHPPTSTPTSTTTPSPTPTYTPTPLPTPSAAPSPSETPSPVPTSSRTPNVSPVPTSSRTPSVAAGSATPGPTGPSPTRRPTRAPTTASWTTVARCDTIDEPGNYRLGADLSAGGDCITMQTSYAILDCAGHSIRGTNFGGAGIAVRKYGVLNKEIPSYLEIRNCRLSHFRYGILVESGTKLVIHDNDSSNNYDDTDPATRFGHFLGAADGGGIRLNNVTDSHVFGNTTLHQAIGIDVRSSSGIIVRGNTASDNSAWGINFQATQNSEASGNVTADNVRKCTWGAGVEGFGCDAGGIILQEGSNNNLVSSNQVIGRNGNGVFIKAHAMPCGSNNSIIGNTITSVLYNSVELGFCSGNKINGNMIRDGLDGIWLGYAHDTEIRNNTIANMRNHGIISSNSYNNMVSGNQVVNSNEGLYFFSEEVDRGAFYWLPAGDYRSHDNCLCANVFQNNATAGIKLKDSTHNQVTNNTFQGNGRTVIVQGNGDGNNMQGNVGWWVPFPLDQLLARASRGVGGPLAKR